jgi:hypothetical protein
MVNYLIRLNLLLRHVYDRIQGIVGSLGDEILPVIDGGSQIAEKAIWLVH